MKKTIIYNIPVLMKILASAFFVFFLSCNDQFSETIIKENKVYSPSGSGVPVSESGWVKLDKNLIPARHGAASAVFKNRLYVYGGEDEGMVRGDMWAYDLLSGDEVKLKPHSQLSHAAMFAASGNLYVFGGRDFSGAPVDTLKKYDIANDEWTVLGSTDVNGSFPSARYSCASAVKTSVNQNVQVDPVSVVYIFGGINASGNLPGELFSLTFNNSNSDKPKWESVSPASVIIPEGRGHSLAIVDDKLYLFGGENTNSYSSRLFIFDTDESTWKENFTQNRPGPRAFSGIASDKRYLYVFGGMREAGSSDELWRYDTSADVWKICSDGPAPRSESAAGFYAGTFVLFGGRQPESGGTLGDLWVFNPKADSLLK